MKVFLDANILGSVLNKEYPRFYYSSRVLSLAENKNFSVFTSPICLAIAYYFSEKKSGAEKAISKIDLLISKIHIADANEKVVRRAVQNKSITDLENGLEYYAALGAGCKCIITEDVDDFHFSEIEILRSDQFLGKYVEAKGK